MVKVECPMPNCRFCENGECQHPRGIYLKWRFAADMGKGNIVCMECLMMELVKPEGA